MSGVALSAALSAASGVGASPPVLTRGRPIASAPQLTYLIKNGLVVPGLTRPQPGGSLAAAFSAPGVITTYAADVPRFPFGGNGLLLDDKQTTNLLLNSAALAAPQTIAIASPAVYGLSFYGTGSVRLQANGICSFYSAAGAFGGITFRDFPGAGANVMMLAQIKPGAGATSVDVIPTGDVRFATFALGLTSSLSDTPNYPGFYVPTTGAPQTVGADSIGALSFPALFPTGAGTVILSAQYANIVGPPAGVLFAVSDVAGLAGIGLLNLGDTQIYALAFSNNATVLRQATVTFPLEINKDRFTVGMAFTASGDLELYRAGGPAAEKQQAGTLDLSALSPARIGRPPPGVPAALTGLYKPVKGTIGPFGYLPYALSYADLVTQVDLAHAAAP